jgi:hypothetical protein
MDLQSIWQSPTWNPIETPARSMMNRLRKKDATMRATAEAAAAAMEARGEHQAAADLLKTIEAGVSHAPVWREQLELALYLVRTCRGLSKLAIQLAEGAREELSLGELPLPPNSGRQRQSLLTALLQHLKKAFTYAELSQLVVGMPNGRASAPPEERKNRLHQRVRGTDLRAVRPYEEKKEAQSASPAQEPTEGV